MQSQSTHPLPSITSNPPHVDDIKYKDEPVMHLTPIRFTSYKIGQRAAPLKPYHQYYETWAHANHMANYIDDINPQSSESPDTAMAPTPAHDVAPSSEHVVMASLPDHDLAPSSQASESADNTYNTILNVTPKKRNKEKLKKTYVMPTWAATKSPLQSGHSVNHTNSEVVAPLFKTSPTDYAALYSILTLTQETSAVVVGPERRNIITLDLDL